MLMFTGLFGFLGPFGLLGLYLNSLLLPRLPLPLPLVSCHHVPKLAEAQLVVPCLVKLLESRLDLLLVQVFANFFELL